MLSLLLLFANKNEGGEKRSVSKMNQAMYFEDQELDLK